MKYNIYCDESCHLKKDSYDVMVLGGIRCPEEYAKQTNEEINSIKEQFGVNRKAEIKWTKVSPAMIEYYYALIDYFFDNSNLSFRGYIARGKTDIRGDLNSDFNEWYYKMYYRMLEYFLDLDSNATYNVYIDIKDTVGATKVNRLRTYLNNHHYKNIIDKAQLVDSSDVAILQLADLIIGALSYKHRGLKTSKAKLQLIEYIEAKANQNMLLTVPYSYQKANWFVWVPDTWR